MNGMTKPKEAWERHTEKTKRETYVFRSDDNIKIDHNSLGFEELEDVQWHDFENAILNFLVL
jgi:hypothetical protein